MSTGDYKSKLYVPCRRRRCALHSGIRRLCVNTQNKGSPAVQSGRTWAPPYQRRHLSPLTSSSLSWLLLSSLFLWLLTLSLSPDTVLLQIEQSLFVAFGQAWWWKWNIDVCLLFLPELHIDKTTRGFFQTNSQKSLLYLMKKMLKENSGTLTQIFQLWKILLKLKIMHRLTHSVTWISLHEIRESQVQTNIINKVKQTNWRSNWTKFRISKFFTISPCWFSGFPFKIWRECIFCIEYNALHISVRSTSLVAFILLK